MAKIPIKILGITSAESAEDFYLLLLQEIGGTRHLPIILTKEEAFTLTLAKHRKSPLKPLFFESFGSVFNQFGIVLEQCYIYGFHREVYYCSLIFSMQQKQVTVDSRLSDAIALVLYLKAPICVEESILDQIQDRVKVYKKTPKHKEVSLDELTNQMKQAAACDNFELASRLRDEIAKRLSDMTSLDVDSSNSIDH